MNASNLAHENTPLGELVPYRPVLSSVPAVVEVDVVAAFLSGRNLLTIRAYRADLEDFATFVGVSTVEEAAEMLLGSRQGDANALALAWRTALVDRKLAAATVNRRLAALRSLVKLGRRLGRVPWTLDVDNLQAQAYRDTRGPGRVGFMAMLGRLADRTDAKAVRDRAIFRLLFNLGLRRAEVVSLDLEHVDLAAPSLSILGKGRTARELLTLPAVLVRALADWIAIRGSAPGPLFHGVHRGSTGARLTSCGLYRTVVETGRAAGVKVRPHGLRHAAITEVLTLNNGNFRAAAKFSRHRSINILAVYDDAREDMAGAMAKLLAGEV
jgi:integrase/recombinase XerC